MTDDELRSIRLFLDSDERDSARAYSDADALLGEVGRLRAELAGRRAGEPFLAGLRAMATDYPSKGRGEILTLACQVRALLDHIDWQANILHDLQTEPAAATLRGQGAAEERARVEQAILGAWEWMRQYDGRGPYGDDARDAAMKHILGAIGREALPDLLPPQEARAALEREKAKVATLRAALERVAENPDGYYASVIAREALKQTE